MFLTILPANTMLAGVICRLPGIRSDASNKEQPRPSGERPARSQVDLSITRASRKRDPAQNFEDACRRRRTVADVINRLAMINKRRDHP